MVDIAGLKVGLKQITADLRAAEKRAAKETDPFHKQKAETAAANLRAAVERMQRTLLAALQQDWDKERPSPKE